MPELEHIAQVIGEWVKKAENDLKAAAYTLNMDKDCPVDTVCFHAQQCVEKIMKALLISAEIVPPKSHDLLRLHELLVPVYRHWMPNLEHLRFLNSASVSFRYPGDSASRDDAGEAYSICCRFRESLLALFQNPSE